MRFRRLVSGARVTRRHGTVVAAAMLVGATLVSASPAAATPANGSYLALGDSVAFGYTPYGSSLPGGYLNASNFTSYANDVASTLGLALTNASCPGETTGSLINVNAVSNGCENTLGVAGGYRTYYHLHVPYQGSQLSYAIKYLTTHPNTQLITIDVGANDAFVCEQITSDGCSSPSELTAVFTSIAHNLATIYAALRNDAHYSGTIVALDYYALNYASPTQVALTSALNAAIAGPTAAFGGVVADGFGAFATASANFGGDPCAAGLLIKNPGWPEAGCNIHPSPLGHQVLASAVLAALG